MTEPDWETVEIDAIREEDFWDLLTSAAADVQEVALSSSSGERYKCCGSRLIFYSHGKLLGMKLAAICNIVLSSNDCQLRVIGENEKLNIRGFPLK